MDCAAIVDMLTFDMDDIFVVLVEFSSPRSLLLCDENRYADTYPLPRVPHASIVSSTLPVFADIYRKISTVVMKLDYTSCSFLGSACLLLL